MRPLGGHIVMSGKGNSAKGRVVMVVDTGELAQSEKEDWIRYPAYPKQKTIVDNQPALAVFDLQVER